MNALDFPHRICMYQLLTSTVIASDGMYNPATGNHSNRPQVVNESETAGFPKLQSIHEFVRDKNLQSGGVLVLLIAGTLNHPSSPLVSVADRSTSVHEPAGHPPVSNCRWFRSPAPDTIQSDDSVPPHSTTATSTATSS